MRSLLLVSVLALVATGCGRRAYRYPSQASFRPPAPAQLTFDALIRHAVALGYPVLAADPARGVFHLHSRVMGRAPVFARRGMQRTSMISPAVVLSVWVRDQEVRVTGQGRYATEDGRLHPNLAQEVERLTAQLERAAYTAATRLSAGGDVPLPPGGYLAPPGPAGYGARTYGVPAYGAPTYGAPTYGAPTYGAPTYGAPTYYGAPALDVPPPAQGPAPVSPAPNDPTPDSAPAPPAAEEPARPPSRALQLGSPRR